MSQRSQSIQEGVLGLASISSNSRGHVSITRLPGHPSSPLLPLGPPLLGTVVSHGARPSTLGISAAWADILSFPGLTALMERRAGALGSLQLMSIQT